jgi:hypothetical protein
MAKNPPIEAFRFSVFGRIGGQRCMNRTYWRCFNASGQDTPTLTKACWLAVFNVFDLAWRNVLPSNYQSLALTCKFTGALGGPTYGSANPAAVFGNRPTAASSGCAGPVIKCVSNAFPGNKVQWPIGKIFLPGVGTGDVTNGVLSNDYLTALFAWQDKLLTTQTNSGLNFVFCVPHIKTGVAALCTQAEVSDTLGVQRGRLRPRY